VPVITPPTTEAAVVVPVTEVLEPVITPPTTLAAVTAPDTDTTEPSKLEPVTVPLALNKPVMYSPVVANTTTFDVPPIETLALPPLTPIATLLVPLTILLTTTALALMLLIYLPSPTKKAAVDMLPVALIIPFDTMVLAVITLAVLKILVQELVELEYWYDTWLTTVTCPFVGVVGKAINFSCWSYTLLMPEQKILILDMFFQFPAFACCASHSSRVM
jgi:hypothetical protein